jgi:hypothetical protein
MKDSNPTSSTKKIIMIIGRIILGLIVAVVGAIVTIKSEWIFKNFGPIPSAEKYLGTEGGSRLAYQLIGIAISIVGFLIMSGLIGAVLTSLSKILVPGSG